MNGFNALFFLAFLCGAFCSCKVTGQVSKSAINTFLNDTAVRTGHAGISIYDPAAKKYLYNHNAEKNFIPSSNVKLFTLYAGMKYLGDSLIGLRYRMVNDTTVDIYSSADPTFLHPDFKEQPAFDFLKKQKRMLFQSDGTVNPYAPGWSWDDYLEEFMRSRSEFPVYANLFTIKRIDKEHVEVMPGIFNWRVRRLEMLDKGFNISGKLGEKEILLENGALKELKVPFDNKLETVAELLVDTLKNEGIEMFSTGDRKEYFSATPIRTQPVDSLFRPMMFNSDNFFAEQTLLMVSNEQLGYMNDEQIIDTLLKTDFKDIPTKPRWVDGCGLSRYNLFSPKDFIYILNKLQGEFGLARMKRILPTGGQGTLTNYYEGDAGYIYAKTGSMSNNVSLSGYLITKKGKLLVFSVIINNFDGAGKSGRRAIERFLKEVRNSN